MSTPIKTKVLLPRASLADWQSSTRVLMAGELVLAYDGNGKFRLFEGDGKTFSAGVKELKLDAEQVVLSGDAEITLQQAIDDIKAAVANALSGVDGTGEGVVTGLTKDSNRVVAQFTNLSGTQAADGTTFNVITSITQGADGKITAVDGISALTEHQSLEDYYTKSETSSAAEIADGLTAAVATAEEYTNTVSAALSGAVDASIAAAVEALDVDDEAVTSQYVTGVSEADGKITVTRGTIALSDLTDSADIVTQDELDAAAESLSADYVEKIGTAKSEAIEAANSYTDDLSVEIYGALEDYALSNDVTALVGAVSATTLEDANGYTDDAAEALSADYVEKIGIAKSEAIEAANEYTDALSTAIDTKLEDFALSADVTALVSDVSAATLTAAESYTDTKVNELSGTLTAYVEKSALSISYDSTAKKIYLSGGSEVSEIDASDFIKDGMLSSATYDPTTHTIILTFNTDAGASPISVDVGSLVDTYTAGETNTIAMSVNDNEFTASVKNGSLLPEHLSADADWVFDCN